MFSNVNIDLPGGSDGKGSACNVGDPGSIPGSGRSPGEGNGNPFYIYNVNIINIPFSTALMCSAPLGLLCFCFHSIPSSNFSCDFFSHTLII